MQEEIDAYDDAAEDEDKARAADAHHASSDEDDVRNSSSCVALVKSQKNDLQSRL